MENFKSKLDNFFQITERGSTVKTEIVGGLTTFFAMCYIMMVNPAYMTQTFDGGIMNMSLFNAVFIATAIGAIVGTLLMALYAKMPFAQAPGMGLNSFFWVAFMIPVVFATADEQAAAFGMGLSVIFLSGIVFLILSVTGARKAIVKSMPDCLKKAIPAGIGLFIAFIGFKNAGIVQANQYTFVQLGNIAVFDKSQFLITNEVGEVIGRMASADIWYLISPIFVAFIGFLLIAILSHYKVKGSVIVSILVSTGLFYLFNIGNAEAFTPFKNMQNVGQSFIDFGQFGIGAAFKGFGELPKHYVGFAGFLSVLMLVITFCLVDMFDTLGTLQGTATEAGMLDDEGNPKRLNQCLMCDSVASVVGAVAGTSTVTTYVESATGVSAGARTGLASVVTAGCFFIAMFLSPVAAIIPSAATAPALIWVGVLMLKNFKAVDMENFRSAVPAFLTLIVMPLSYSISNGIAVGMISYTVLTLLAGKFGKKDIIVAVLGALFLVRFLCVYM